MRFLADMGISMRTVEWLRQQGHDAVHLREEGLQRLEDPDILTKARAEERTLLTMDLDFGYLLAVGGGQLPSVVLFRLSDERSEVVNARLADVLTRCEPDLQAGAIVSVSDTAARVRLLPIRWIDMSSTMLHPWALGVRHCFARGRRRPEGAAGR